MSWLSDFVSNPVQAVSNGINNAGNAISDQIGAGDNSFVRQWLTNPIGRTIDPFDWGGQIGDAMKPPDYSGPEGAAQKALDDEKKRRATEANRRDLQSSQLARLFLSDNGAQEETFNFMGL